jgi:Tfp pilus assembly protein PilN
MRPVNLIPPEDRRGDRAPLRAGALSYIVIGTCAAALVAVLALVLTGNSVTEKENELASLEVARDAADQRATALAPYAEFATLQQQREQTIRSLAESRFDWERVLRELALVMPGNVTLGSLEAAVAKEADSASTTAVSSPSLTMSGCGPNHDAVAEFVASLEDIDGITRVGLEKSVKSTGDTTAGASPATGAGSTGGSTESASCPPNSASFSLTAVFDNAIPAVPAEGAPATPGAPAAPAPETNSASEQVQEGQEAANLVPGAAR